MFYTNSKVSVNRFYLEIYSLNSAKLKSEPKALHNLISYVRF